jgi:hypothetical protein
MGKVVGVVTVVGALLVSSTVLATRASRARSDLTTCRQNLSILAAESRSFGRVILDLVETDLSLGSSVIEPGPGHKVYVIVDTGCVACRRFLKWAETAELKVAMEVASFRDSAAHLEGWLEEIGSSIPRVPLPLDSTFLRHLPRTISPLFIEFDRGRPLLMKVGRPSDSWSTSDFPDL